MYMQTDQGNETSDCIVTFDEFIVLAQELKEKNGDLQAYLDAFQAKGQGSGTEVGFLIENSQRYIDIAIFGVNVFNYCNLDYYLVSIGKSTGSVSGAINQGVNLFWRLVSEEDMRTYYDLDVALIQNDIETAGQKFGTWISALLQVEITTNTESSSYQSVGQLM